MASWTDAEGNKHHDMGTCHCGALHALEGDQRRTAELESLRAQVAALTQERDDAVEQCCFALNRAEAAKGALVRTEVERDRAEAALANTRQALELAQQLLPNAGETARQIILRALAGDNTTPAPETCPHGYRYRSDCPSPECHAIRRTRAGDTTEPQA